MSGRKLALGAAVGLIAAGCQVILGIEDRHHDAVDASSPPDATIPFDAGPEAPDPRPACVPVHAPDPTGAGADSSVQVGETTFALRDVLVDHALEAGAGYDLDGVCTCVRDAPPSCNRGDAGKPSCEDTTGRDNAVARLLGTLLVSQDFGERAMNDAIAAGTVDFLISVDKYNGTENDPQVDVTYYLSGGLSPVDAGADTGADGGASAGTAPRWDGTDTWTVDPRTFFPNSDGGPSSNPRYYTSAAYVTNFVMVARLPDLRIALGGLAVQLVDVVITARLLNQGDGDYPFGAAKGQLSGRWKTADLLASLGVIQVGKDRLCPGNKYYDNAKNNICAHRDLASSPDADSTGAPCGALSLGMGFSLYPVHRGALRKNELNPQECEGGAPDDCP